MVEEIKDAEIIQEEVETAEQPVKSAHAILITVSNEGGFFIEPVQALVEQENYRPSIHEIHTILGRVKEEVQTLIITEKVTEQVANKLKG